MHNMGAGLGLVCGLFLSALPNLSLERIDLENSWEKAKRSPIVRFSFWVHSSISISKMKFKNTVVQGLVLGDYVWKLKSWKYRFYFTILPMRAIIDELPLPSPVWSCLCWAVVKFWFRSRNELTSDLIGITRLNFIFVNIHY